MVLAQTRIIVLDLQQKRAVVSQLEGAVTARQLHTLAPSQEDVPANLVGTDLSSPRVISPPNLDVLDLLILFTCKIFSNIFKLRINTQFSISR